MILVRLVAINIVFTAFLVLLSNFIAGLWLDETSQRAQFEGAQDGRISTPAYSDKAHARQIFHDFYNTRTDYSPYEAVRLKPFSSETLHIGPDGLRITPKANPSGYPVHFFGGSTMWGTGVDDDHTIPALVQAKNPEIKAINHGQSGFVSLESVAALVKMIALGEQLGTVVFYDGVNDVFHLCQDRTSLDGHAFEYFMRRAVDQFTAVLTSQSDRAITSSFGNLLELARRISGTNPTKTTEVADIPANRCSGNPHVVEQIAQILWRNWSTAKKLVEANGGRFIGILQPVSSVGSARREYLRANPEWDQWYISAYERVRALIRDDKSGAFYDFTDAFDGNQALYIDWAHVTSEGNLRIANRIQPILAAATKP